MQFFQRSLAVLTALILSASLANAQYARKPLSRGDVMALVAGNALDQDIADEIAGRGLAFHPGDAYLALLKAAGATPVVFSAFQGAKITASAQAANVPVDAFIQHLAKGSELIEGKNYKTAEQELNAAFESGAESNAAFVAGRLFTEEQDFPGAAEAYAQALKDDPDFTAAHIKLSYVFHRLGLPQQAFSEAHAVQNEQKALIDILARLGKTEEAENLRKRSEAVARP